MIATQFKVERIATLDLLVDDLSRDADSFTTFCVVDPKLDIGNSDSCWPQVFEIDTDAVLFCVNAHRDVRVLREQRRRESEQKDNRNDRTVDEFQGFVLLYDEY